MVKLQHLKNTGISALRYPEGHQVSYWDWEFPYHEPYQDIWSPRYESTLTPEKRAELKEKYKHRMLIDDYFEICKEANIEPVIGINMFLGWKHDRKEESIQKAVKLVEHCLQIDPTITYFFLDNEVGHQPEKNNHVPIENYIKLIPAYSKAIKAVHPGYSDRTARLNNLKNELSLITPAPFFTPPFYARIGLQPTSWTVLLCLLMP